MDFALGYISGVIVMWAASRMLKAQWKRDMEKLKNKMKYSKQLPYWLRKRCWATFMAMTPKMRRFVYNNSFESMCSGFIGVK